MSYIISRSFQKVSNSASMHLGRRWAPMAAATHAILPSHGPSPELACRLCLSAVIGPRWIHTTETTPSPDHCCCRQARSVDSTTTSATARRVCCVLPGWSIGDSLGAEFLVLVGKTPIMTKTNLRALHQSSTAPATPAYLNQWRLEHCLIRQALPRSRIPIGCWSSSR